MSSWQPEIHDDDSTHDATSAEGLGLYVHIPFCQSRCLYCDFHSTATDRLPWPQYLEALTAELEMLDASPFGHRRLETLFVGGGTPTLFPPTFFERLLDAIFSRFPPVRDIEATVECNPGTVTAQDLKQLHALGLNRLSLGVQSFQDRHLKTLTRIHDGKTALETIHRAEEAGFDNISVDLIWGIPGQSVEDWIEDLTTLSALPVSHCATYALTVYEGTRLAQNVVAGRLELPDDDTLVAMYHASESILGQNGFTRYEISNWSRRRPCRHNLRYWQGHDWLGIGSGAHAYSASFALEADRNADAHRPPRFVPAPHGGRWWTHLDIRRYVSNCTQHQSPYAGWETLTLQQAMTETLMTQLRRDRGLDLESFTQRFGLEPTKQVMARSRTPALSDLVEATSQALRLTREGVLFADRVILELSDAADAGLRRTPHARDVALAPVAARG